MFSVGGLEIELFVPLHGVKFVEHLSRQSDIDLCTNLWKLRTSEYHTSHKIMSVAWFSFQVHVAEY